MNKSFSAEFTLAFRTGHLQVSDLQLCKTATDGGHVPRQEVTAGVTTDRRNPSAQKGWRQAGWVRPPACFAFKTDE